MKANSTDLSNALLYGSTIYNNKLNLSLSLSRVYLFSDTAGTGLQCFSFLSPSQGGFPQFFQSFVSVFLSPVSWLCCLSPSSLLHFSFWVISFLWVDAIRGFFCYQEWWFIEGSQNNFSTGEHKAASKGFKKDKIFFFSFKKTSIIRVLVVEGLHNSMKGFNNIIALPNNFFVISRNFLITEKTDLL